MTLLSDIRARERAERRSNIEQDLSGGSLPALRRGARAVTVVQELAGRADVLRPKGEVCSVKAVDVAVSTTAAVVEWTVTVGEQAWGAVQTLPTTDIVPTFADAYYDVQVELDRGAYAGTVQVEVLRGDTVVWGPGESPYWADPDVPVVAKGRLSLEVDGVMEPWTVRLTGSTSGTLDAVHATVELVDRARLLPAILVAAFSGGTSGFGALTLMDGPTVVSTVDLWADHDLYRPRFVAGTSGYAFVGVGSGDNSAVAAFSTGNVALLSQVTIVADAASNPGKMRLDGSVLWVPAGESHAGLFAVDVSVPSALSVLGSVAGADLQGAEDVEVSGSTVFVAARNASNGKVVAVNGSDPTSPTVISSLASTSVLRNPTGLARTGTTLLVACNGDGSTVGDALVAVDVSDTAAMSIAGSLQDHTNLRNAFKVVTDGTYAYVTTTAGLTVVDISTLGSMSVAGTLAGDMSGDVAMRGTTLHVGSGDTGGVTVVDVSDPTSPTEVAVVDVDPTGGATGVWPV